MTLNNCIYLFKNIVSSHYMLKGFGFGNLFEINGQMKPGLQYYLLWVIPLESTTTEQTKQRKFSLLTLGLVKKDLSNRDEVWSDTEQCMDDIIKILRNESDAYNLIGEPSYVPVTEQHGDWVTGWQTEIVLETDFNSNYCDIPSDMVNSMESNSYATVYDQDGNIVTKLYPGAFYNVIIASGIDSGGSSTTYSIQVLDNG